MGKYVVRTSRMIAGFGLVHDEFGPYSTVTEAENEAARRVASCACIPRTQASVHDLDNPPPSVIITPEVEAVERDIDGLYERFAAGEDVSREPGFNPDWCD